MKTPGLLQRAVAAVATAFTPVPLAPADPAPVVAAAALPPDVPAGLARILRPQAASRWLLPQLASMTPQYIESVLRSAMAGDHVRGWELFDLMEDTWPRLRKNAMELKNGVRNLTPQYDEFVEEDEQPTATATEKMKTVSAALRSMRPDAAADENALAGTINDLMDAWLKGTSILEVDWQITDAGKLGRVVAPRATFWVHPVCYGWSNEGRLGLSGAGRGNGVAIDGVSSLSALTEFPPDKFLIALSKSKSGSPLAGSLLRPLAWWWCAANFSADWLLNLAQVFGLPFRWANYDPNAPQATIDAICSMLQNMGSAGWAAFPAGTTLELKGEGQKAENSPQADMLDRADKNCDLLILGQTLTSDVGGAGRGGGSLALGKVHAGVKGRHHHRRRQLRGRRGGRPALPVDPAAQLRRGQRVPALRPGHREGGRPRGEGRGREHPGAGRGGRDHRAAVAEQDLRHPDAGAEGPHARRRGRREGAAGAGHRQSAGAQGCPGRRRGRGEQAGRPGRDHRRRRFRPRAFRARRHPHRQRRHPFLKMPATPRKPVVRLFVPAGPQTAFCKGTASVCKTVSFDAAPLVCENAESGDDSALIAGSSFAAPETATGELMYMPAGIHQIVPSQHGKPVVVQVQVDRESAAALEGQRAALAARGKRPFFDFNHDDQHASFWPEEFVWRDAPQPGVYARGEWTKSGRDGVEGKDWRQFSPMFHVDSVKAKPARIVCNPQAKPNMGGLVNDPAFSQILPLWAKDAAGAQSSPQDPTHPKMTSLELTALENKNKEIQKELDTLKEEKSALKAKQENDALVSAQISAKEGEFENNRLKIEFEGLLAKNKIQGEAIKARNETDAKAEVKLAVERGAIAAKDQVTQDFLILKATEDPAFLPVIKAMAGNAALSASGLTREATTRAAREGQGGARIVHEAPSQIIKAYGAILARNAALPISDATYKDKNRLALESAALFAKEIMDNPDVIGMPIEDMLKAADFADPAGNLGLLSGTLVLQNTLTKMQFNYPQLFSIFTDFSAEPGLFLQTQMSRIVLTPAVQTYNPAVDASGRPLGWTTVSPAQTVNVPVTLDEYVGIPIVFGQQTLASTTRNLFGEISDQALYALGGYFVQKMMKLFTAANYNAYAANSAAGGSTTSGSPAITVTSTAGMYPGQLISGTGIAANSFVLAVHPAPPRPRSTTRPRPPTRVR